MNLYFDIRIPPVRWTTVVGAPRDSDCRRWRIYALQICIAGNLTSSLCMIPLRQPTTIHDRRSYGPLFLCIYSCAHPSVWLVCYVFILREGGAKPNLHRPLLSMYLHARITASKAHYRVLVCHWATVVIHRFSCLFVYLLNQSNSLCAKHWSSHFYFVVSRNVLIVACLDLE